MASLRHSTIQVFIVALLVALAGAIEVAVRLAATWFSSSALAPHAVAAAGGRTVVAGLVVGLGLVVGRAIIARAAPKMADWLDARLARWVATGGLALGGLALGLAMLGASKILDSAALSYLGETALVMALVGGLFLGWNWARRRVGAVAAAALALILILGLTVVSASVAERFRLTRHYRPAGGGGGRPNILLISIDTLRADRLGAYGYAQAQTPNLDRLAAEGTLFERAFSHSSWTRPGFGSLMTSLYPSEHGAFTVNDPEQAQEGYVSWQERVYNGPLRQEVTTLAEALDRAGYFNLALQSNWHASQFNDFDQGFDIFLFDELRRQPMWEATVLGKGWQRLTAKLTGGESKSVREETMPSADLYRGWSQFVAAGLSRPFFVWVNLLNVHDPYNLRDYSTVDGPLQAPVVASYEANDPAVDVATLSRAYDSEVTYADAWVGRMLEDLRSRGLLDSTLVVVTADHGEELGDHAAPLPRADGKTVYGRFHGHTLFREQVHVPWIMRLPGVLPAGRRVPQQVPHLDFAPTVADYAGARPAAEWRGSTLRGRIEEEAGDDGQAAGSTTIFAERPLYGTDLKSITVEDAKAVWNTATGEWRFFDLTADPNETVALEDPEREAELRRRLTAFSQEMGPLLPESGSRGEMSQEELEQLRALGYVQ